MVAALGPPPVGLGPALTPLIRVASPTCSARPIWLVLLRLALVRLVFLCLVSSMAPCTGSLLLAYRIHTVYALRAPLTHTACTLRAVRVSPTGTRYAHRSPAVVLLSGCAAPLVAGVACGALLCGVVRDLLLRRWLKTAKSARVWLSLTFQPSTSTRPPGLGLAVWGLFRCGWGSMRVVVSVFLNVWGPWAS